LLLLVTNRDDITADWLVLELRRRGTPFVRFNTEDYPTRVRLHWTPSQASLVIDGREITADAVTGVWWRRALPPQFDATLSAAEEAWAANEALAALKGFWQSLDARWVNPPAGNVEADCKPEQLRRAAQIGFDVPPTLITNDVDAARAFIADHETVVCKSLHDARVPRGDGGDSGLFYTSVVRLDDLSAPSAFGAEPYLLQALVDKSCDLRVTVIGEQTYACRIESQSWPEARIDWRLGDVARMPHAPDPLESDVADRCIALTQSYGLRFSAIDLARRPDGSCAFFELNANGQWAWVEQLTGLPLASRLADELLAS
jgi:glutathione synthase/RimK-type ligase-like ATP-grasp enzyme